MDTFVVTLIIGIWKGMSHKKNQSCTDKQGKGLSVNPFSAIEMYIQHMMSFILLSGWVGSTVKYKRALILSLQSLMLIWSSSWSWGCHGLFSDQVDYRKASSHMKVVYIRRGVLYHWAFFISIDIYAENLLLYKATPLPWLKIYNCTCMLLAHQKDCNYSIVKKKWSCRWFWCNLFWLKFTMSK